MFNLAEILTLLIGCLLALVFIDGIRRALRIRQSKLKVDLINTSIDSSSELDFEEEWHQGFEEKNDTEELIPEAENEVIEPDITPLINLNIISLTSTKFRETKSVRKTMEFNCTICEISNLQQHYQESNGFCYNNTI